MIQLRLHIEIDTIKQADQIIEQMINRGLVNTETDLAGITDGTSVYVKKYMPKKKESS